MPSVGSESENTSKSSKGKSSNRRQARRVIIYKALILGLLVSMGAAMAQTTPSPDAAAHKESTGTSQKPSPQVFSSAAAELPDSPGALIVPQDDVVAAAKIALKKSGKERPSCNVWRAVRMIYFDPKKMGETPPPCSELVYPYQRFLDNNIAFPLTWQQKGYLAIHYTTDPANLGTIIGISAITIAADSHTAYGPGFKGWGELSGVSLLQDATGQFFGVFAIPAITHQDPRYYRMTKGPFGKRLFYAFSRTYVSRSDSGKTIPNYGVIGAYPIASVISNLYVPGIESDGASTGKRIAIGLALEPINNIVSEFLPDVANHIHVRVIFVQQILNNIAVNQAGPL
jgi:hypothetical protein